MATCALRAPRRLWCFARPAWRHPSRLKLLDAAHAPASSRSFAGATESACFLHKRPVRSVNFSSDGQLLCTSSEDGAARVYDMDTGRLLKEVDHGTTIWWSDFSADASMLCTASDDRSVRVYDCKTWGLLEMFGHGLPVKCASFSPDNRYVATASGDAFVRIFELESGEEMAKLKHDSWVMAVRYSADGRLLATGCADKWVRVFDARSLAAKPVMKKKYVGLVTCVDFSPDSRTFCASTTRAEDQTQIVEVETGQREMAIEQDALTISARFSPDGASVCTASGDKTRVYDVGSGQMLHCFEHGVHVNYATMRRDGLVCTASQDGALRFFAASDNAPEGHVVSQRINSHGA